MWAVVDDATNEDDNKNNCDVDLLSLPPLLAFSLSYLPQSPKAVEAHGQSLRFFEFLTGTINGERSPCWDGEACLGGVTGKEASGRRSKCKCSTLLSKILSKPHLSHP